MISWIVLSKGTRSSRSFKLPLDIIGKHRLLSMNVINNDFCCPLAMPQMADPSKRKIYEFLSMTGEKTVSELTAIMKLKQPTVSYHLRQMEKGGLLTSRKEGRKVYYSVKMGCLEGGACFGG